MAIGKFHGVISAITPSGSRWVKSNVSGVLAGIMSPAGAKAFAGVIPEDVAGAHHFALRLSQRLALFARQDFCQLIQARIEDLAGLVENGAAAGAGQVAPLGQRGFCSSDGALGVFGSCRRK